tara:strand:+ start:7306 stop:8583 length:1278 start_codon:yes stop_codon:yes gene_type:complete
LGIKIDISGLVKSLIGSAGIFILGMMFSFIFNWAITKYLPQNEVGFFQYFISIITFAMVIVPLGFQALAQREVVKLNKKSLIQLSKQASISILISSCIFGLLWFFGVKKYKWVKDLKEYSGLAVSIFIIPIYALNVYFKAVLQGQNKIYSSIVPDVLIRPILLLIFLPILPLFGLKINPTSILTLLLFILTGTLIFSIFRINFNLVQSEKKPRGNKWLKQALIILPIGLLSTINERVDVVMVSKILGPESNAVYGIAFKFALFSGFGLVILNQIMVPHYAQHFNEDGNQAELQKKISTNVRLAFILSLSVALFLFFVGENLLSWFGKSTESYILGYKTMLILTIGQLFNVAFGSTGYLLTMAKKESLVLISIGCGVLANIVLNFFLVPILKIEGAAIATSSSIIVWNVMMLIFVKRKLKINPTIF